MRLFETLLLLSLLLALGSSFLPRASRAGWLRRLPPVVTLLAILHLAFEGTRWQLYPAYLMAAVCVVALLRPLPRVVSALGVLLVALSAALAALLPVFELPPPEGPHRVGTVRLVLTDAARSEPFTADPDDRRTLLVEAWYPAEPDDSGSPAPYLAEAPLVFPALLQFLSDAASVAASEPGSEPEPEWTPTFLFDHLELVESHAWQDATPFTAGPAWPVLIFSHGYLGGYVRQNTMLMEQLASHGYAVFSIGHSHETMLSIDADGRVVPLDYRNPLLRPQLRAVVTQNSPPGRTLISQMLVAPSPAEQDRLLRAYLSETVADWYGVSGPLWLDDTRFVLSEIEKLNAEGRFAGRLDTKRLGLLGMSFGGKLVARFCAEDARCVAGVDLDGGLPLLATLDDLPTQPMLVLYPIEKRERYAMFYDRLRGPVYRVALLEATHQHLMEISLATHPLTSIDGIEAFRAHEIINAYTLAFLDQYVRGRRSQLLDRDSPYPEAELTRP